MNRPENAFREALAQEQFLTVLSREEAVRRFETALRPAPVGASPAGASAYGVEQMLGDVWEWTTSPLRPWPDFVPMIYARYSQPFFDGDYRVLRGGSWAVEAAILRPSFRNWDHPYRRQIFSGVRLAWDVGD